MIPKKIVAIGASSCEGKVDALHGGFVGRLRAWHESLSDHHSVYNLGISGDTTEKVLKRLPLEVPPRRPNLIIVQCGINDFIHVGSKNSPIRFSIQQIQTNISSILTVAKEFADVLFVSVFPIDETKTCPCSWKDIYYLERDAKQCAKISQEIAMSMKVPYVDVYNTFIQEDYKKYLHVDGLHPNSLGHEAIFQMVKSKLIDIYSLS
jgi:lysophospholipase L1-like esterase